MQIQLIASGSSGNCYRVSDGYSSLLLDAGISIKRIKQGLNYKLHEVAGVLITHEHLDHAKAVYSLAKSGIDCYMSKGTKIALEINSRRLKTIKTKEQITIGTFQVVAFEVTHDAVEPVGFLIKSMKTGESLVYITDTQYCKYRFKNLDYILIEVNYDYEIVKENVLERGKNEALAHRVYGSHMSLDTAKGFIEQNKSKKLKAVYLLHLSDDNSNEEHFKREIQKLTGVPVYVA